MRLWIPEDRIAHHIVIQGATGTRKSVLARSFAYQFIRRGWPLVIHDPKGEFTAEFARDNDWVLNPGDTRCPRWEIENEAESEMHAYALAQSAFPSEPGENPFFRRQPRQILARLLGVEHPTTDQLAEWLIDDKQIDRRLRGTHEGKSIVKEGPEMRAGVLATLSELGRSLRLWPTGEQQSRSFSARKWAVERKGNIFLSSTPDTIDALRPSLTMLLDSLIVATQRTVGPGAFLMDEIAQLNRIDKLETAMSLQRAAGNPIVLIFQEVSQLRKHYGELWPALVSQAYTQIVFRTSEPDSAKHASGILGQQEVERVRESRSRGNIFFHRPHRSFQSERVTTPLILPGEIQSLPDGEGYMAQAGRVVKINIQWTPPVIRAPRLIERIIKPPQIEPESEPVPRPSRYSKPKPLPLAKEA